MPRRSSVLLINESPLQTLPSLACLVGINGAIILQQMQYWLNVSEHKIEGYAWIYNSYDKWAKQFKWLKLRSVQKHILALERGGFLISKQFRYKTRNNTKWYRIDYDRLNEEYQRLIDCEKSNSLLPKSNSDGEKSNSDGEKSNSHSTKNSQCLKLNFEQTTQENTQKTITEDIQYIWQETLVHLKEKTNPPNYRTWLASTVPVSFDGDTFVVSAGNKFTADYLHKNMASLIEGVLCSVVGRQVKFKCQEGEGSGGEA